MGSRKRPVVANGNPISQIINTKQSEKRKLKKEFRNNSAKSKHSTKSLQVIAKITICFMLIFMCSLYYLHSSKTNRILKISEVLRKNVKLCEKIIFQVQELNELILEDPIIDLIKTRMRPITERIASLKTQTLQYEQMEHIPGGPRQFMSSTLIELDRIETEHLEKIGLEVSRSISKQYTTVVGLAATTNGILKDSEILTQALQNDDTLRSLISDGIFLVPLDGNFNHKFEYNSSSIIESHLVLANLYEQLESIIEKMERKYGFSLVDMQKISGEVANKDLFALLTEYVQLKELIHSTVLKDNEKYPLLGILKQNALTKVQELFKILMKYETEKRRPWLELESMTRSEIENLRKRVQKLKYSMKKS